MSRNFAPCVLNCPAHVDICGYINLIKQEKFADAIKLIMETLPLPGSIARICPRPCESNCTRRFKDGAVDIAQLRIFLSDIQKSFAAEIKKDTGKKIGIIGSGPAGICSAYFLRSMGHRVSVFDSMPKVGGMLRYGVPEFRLPYGVLDKEVNFLSEMNIDLHCNTEIDTEKFDLMQSQFDAVIIAVGAWDSLRIKCPGTQNFIEGIKFLKDAAMNKENIVYAKKVAVIGGGNTAIDVCRSAIRFGAKNVVNIYRRTKNEMPAQLAEINAACEEGVIFKELLSPIEVFIRAEKKILVMQKYKLGEKGRDGRFFPVKTNDFVEEEFDLLISAIGQKVSANFFGGEKNFDGTIKVDEFFQTSYKNVFAIGDVINKSENAIAIQAISNAKSAACFVNNFLLHKPFLSKCDDMKKVFDIDCKQNFFVTSLKKEKVLREAARCLNCGGCKNDL